MKNNSKAMPQCKITYLLRNSGAVLIPFTDEKNLNNRDGLSVFYNIPV